MSDSVIYVSDGSQNVSDCFMKISRRCHIVTDVVKVSDGVRLGQEVSDGVRKVEDVREALCGVTKRCQEGAK